MNEVKSLTETLEAVASQIETSAGHEGRTCDPLAPDPFPADRPHEGGDPALDDGAQYGASPIREARYDENHEANTDMAASRLKSGHHGAQARYPHADELTPKGSTGHDEQQMSRTLKENGR